MSDKTSRRCAGGRQARRTGTSAHASQPHTGQGRPQDDARPPIYPVSAVCIPRFRDPEGAPGGWNPHS